MRILLVEDQDLVRKALIYLLRDLIQDLEIFDARDCTGAEAFRGRPLDLVLLDLHLPGITGTEGISWMLDAFAPTRVVVLSADEDIAQIQRAIKAGAVGYIRKSDDPDILEPALRLVLAGGIYIPSQALEHDTIADAPATIGENGHLAPASLTEREREVMNKAIEGAPTKQIARDLDISTHTVKAHLSSAYRKLGVTNKTAAVYALAKRDRSRWFAG